MNAIKFLILLMEVHKYIDSFVQSMRDVGTIDDGVDLKQARRHTAVRN